MTDQIKEGLGELADRAERDHEVQMARSDLYKIAKYAIKLHDMLKRVSEEQGLEGWVQSKITKSADYIGSVYHHLDYEEATGELGESAGKASCGCGPDCKHCGGKHSMEEVGQTCECCGNKVKEVAAEGKFKSAAHRKAVHAAKASGQRKKKKLRDSEYFSHLSYMLEKKVEASKSEDSKTKKRKKLKASVTPPSAPEKISPSSISADNISPDSGGHPTGS